MEKSNEISDQLDEPVTLVEKNSNSEPPAKKPRKKLSQTAKYVIYIVVILVITTVAIIWEFGSAGATETVPFDMVAGAENIGQTFKEIFANSTQIAWFFASIGCVLLTFTLDALVLFMFTRLFTRKYTFIQSLAANSVKLFYDGVTPLASGGQVMQASTMKKQGIPIASAASILIMTFIVYQVALVILGVVAFIVEFTTILETAVLPVFGVEIPIWWAVIIGFVFNVAVIVFLFLASFSKLFLRFVNGAIIPLLGKMKILKHPEKTKESVKIQIENFRIELRRLFSNIPFTITVFLVISTVLIINNGIPYFTGQAVGAIDSTVQYNYFDFVLLTAFHQMITGVVPTPGGVGGAEGFFYSIFHKIYVDGTTKTHSSSLIWRTITFTLPMIITGFISAFYKSSSKPKELVEPANRRTFANIQMQTYEERKRSSDILYETAQLNRQALQNKIFRKRQSRLDNLKVDDEADVIVTFSGSRDARRIKKEKVKKVRVSHRHDSEWKEIKIGEEEEEK